MAGMSFEWDDAAGSAMELRPFGLPFAEDESGLSGPGTGERARQPMRKQIKYADEPMEFEIIEDFLPPPEELVRRARKVKVTLEVSEPTVRMFRKKAGRSADGYRRMMGQLLDFYAARQQ
jgi:hypothetical protein